MGFPNLGNMGEMIKMAREMQGQMKKIKDELSRQTYEAEAGGVRVTISGDMEIKEIKTAASDQDRAVKDAVNKALKMAKEDASKKMKGLTGGLGLPGF